MGLQCLKDSLKDLQSKSIKAQVFQGSLDHKLLLLPIDNTQVALVEEFWQHKIHLNLIGSQKMNIMKQVNRSFTTKIAWFCDYNL